MASHTCSQCFQSWRSPAKAIFFQKMTMSLRVRRPSLRRSYRSFAEGFVTLFFLGRKVTTFSKDDVIYNVGDRNRTLFFLQNGFVKVGADHLKRPRGDL